MSQRKKTFFIILFFSFIPDAFAGAYFKINTKGVNDNGTTQIYIDQARMKIDVKNRNGFIYDKGTQLITIISDKKREYWQMNKQEIQKTAKKVQVFADKMKKQIAKMSPQHRKMMLEMMSGKVSDPSKSPAKEKKFTLKKIKSGVKVGKWSTTQYASYLDGVKKSDLYFTGWKKLGLKKDPTALAMELSRTLSTLFGNAPAMRKTPQKHAMFNQAENWLKHGIPIKIVNFRNGKVTKTSIVTEVKNSNFSAKTFVPPKGYAKKKNPLHSINKL